MLFEMTVAATVGAAAARLEPHGGAAREESD